MESSGIEKNGLSGLEYAIAGATSGVGTRFLLQPLDVLKIRFQLQSSPISARQKSKYTSIYQALRLIAREEGVGALWKGHIPAQYLSIIFGGVQFSTHEILSGYIQRSNPQLHMGYEPLVNIFCGSVAGLVAVVLSFPFDVIRTLMVYQSEPKVYKGTLDTIRKIYHKEGLGGFKKGMLLACVHTVPASGLVFCFHGMFTDFWVLLFEDVNTTKPRVISTTGSITTGLLAGLSTKAIVYPFDLMKKRLQIQGMDEQRTCSKKIIKCTGIIHCMQVTMRNEGFLGFFKGFMPSLIKAGATTSVYFTIYDKICQFLLHTGRR